MTTILKQEDTKELYERLYAFPSLYDDLTPYQRDEVYQYAQRKLTERVVYWSGAIDSPVNIETAARAGYSEENVLEYFLSCDDTSRRARAVIYLIENRNQKKFDTEKLTKEKKPRNQKSLRIMYALSFGLLCKMGEINLEGVAQTGIDDLLKEKFHLKDKGISILKVRRIICNQNTDDLIVNEEKTEHGFIISDDRFKSYAFHGGYFEQLTEFYPDEFKEAEKVVEGLK